MCLVPLVQVMHISDPSLLCSFIHRTEFNGTVEPRFMDTRLIQTPHNYGQFSLSLGQVHTFSFNSTRLIWTPVFMQILDACYLPSEQIHIER